MGRKSASSCGHMIFHLHQSSVIIIFFTVHCSNGSSFLIISSFLSYLLVSSLLLSFGQYCRPSACSDPVPQPVEPSMFRCAAGILPLPQSSSIHPFVGIACGRCVFTLFFRRCGFLAGIRLKQRKFCKSSGEGKTWPRERLSGTR